MGRPVEGPVFTHLWRAAVASSHSRKRFSIHQQNVLLFQMGKVASSALSVALLDQGINCFHCHSLRYADEASRLCRVFESKPDVALAARDLNLLTKHTALNMLVRWYQANEVPLSRKLKVVTLTRDPATWFASHLLQRFGHDARQLVAWHRELTGANTDVGTAAAEMFRQAARLILQSRPSVDAVAARKRAMALAEALVPLQPCVVESIKFAFGPVSWFDTQFTPLLGIDLQDLPELRESGLAHRDVGSIEVLVVRFEDLARHVSAIAQHVGLPSLVIPPRNVTAEKSHAAPVLEAAREFFSTDLGTAFQREMRGTKYARACGYDVMSL